MTTLPENWPALVAGARVALEGPQRAYRAGTGSVRFYPSMALRWPDGEWDVTICSERGRPSVGERLPDAEAAALWATRPDGVK